MRDHVCVQSREVLSGSTSKMNGIVDTRLQVACLVVMRYAVNLDTCLVDKIWVFCNQWLHSFCQIGVSIIIAYDDAVAIAWVVNIACAPDSIDDHRNDFAASSEEDVDCRDCFATKAKLWALAIPK